MSATAVRRATYEDVLRAPPNHITQVIFGVLHSMPRPSAAHTGTSSGLAVLLGGPFRYGIGGPGGWLILEEPELHLGSEPDILVPDLAGWRRDRGAVPNRGDTWFSIAPDWICEVLSPSTQKIDRTDKMEIYLREQVRHLWLIEPLAEVLEVYKNDGHEWVRKAAYSSGRARVEPFDAVELDVGLLWQF